MASGRRGEDAGKGLLQPTARQAGAECAFGPAKLRRLWCLRWCIGTNAHLSEAFLLLHFTHGADVGHVDEHALALRRPSAVASGADADVTWAMLAPCPLHTLLHADGREACRPLWLSQLQLPQLLPQHALVLPPVVQGFTSDRRCCARVRNARLAIRSPRAPRGTAAPLEA